MAALDFLDSAVAPQSQDGRLLYLRIIGTDPEEFRQSFDRFYIADGTPIPPGQRGFLFSKRTYEKLIKNLVARELDDIHEQVHDKHEVIADEPLIQAQIERLSRQYPRIVFQLSPDDAKAIEAGLRAKFPDEQGGLNELVSRLLKVDDATLDANYALFYELIAPRIKLYDIPVGDTITLRAYTKAGYVRSVNLPVYGTFEFQGLETSDLASATNLTDLVTFRELYGKMSASQQAELKDIAASVGAKDVSRENAEAELFGGTSGIEATADDAAPDLAAATGDASFANVQGGVDTKVYSPDEMRNGLTLNAAVILKDPVRILETTKASSPSRRAWAAGGRLEGGDRNRRPVRARHAARARHGAVHHLHRRAPDHQQRDGARDARAHERDRNHAGDRRAARDGRGALPRRDDRARSHRGLARRRRVDRVRQLAPRRGHPRVRRPAHPLVRGSELFPTWTARTVLLGVGSVVTAGVVSTLYPAFLAARIQPVVAMQKGD
jgi:hypothetical protein